MRRTRVSLGINLLGWAARAFAIIICIQDISFFDLGETKEFSLQRPAEGDLMPIFTFDSNDLNGERHNASTFYGGSCMDSTNRNLSLGHNDHQRVRAQFVEKNLPPGNDENMQSPPEKQYFRDFKL